MIQQIGRYAVVMMAFSLILGVAVGCSSKEEKAKTEKTTVAPGSDGVTAPYAASAAAQSAGTEKKADEAGTAVEVDGVKLPKAQLNAQIQQQLAQYKGQIPADQIEQAKADIRKGLVDDFVVFVLMNKEVAAKKVTASDKEIEKEIPAVMERMKSQLPAGVTIDELAKKKQINMAKMRDDIGMRIKVNKLIEKELGGKVKITDKEIAVFYESNKDKFMKPETAHVRHVLVGKSPEDTEKKLVEKKAKAEDLRKKLVGGADFADLAAKNSDCPSKQAGGDIGSIGRGQTVKPFDDAAFSQAKNAIGPVVETKFGYHIIQVIDRQAPQMVKLDADVKKQIKAHLESLRQQGAMEAIVKRLKAAANIVVNGA